MQKNLILVGGSLASLGIIATGVANLTKKKQIIVKKSSLPSSIEPLKEYVDEELLLIIATNSTWTELCDRISEFVVLYKEEIVDFLKAVASVVAFHISMQVNGRKISLGTPRLFRTKLHAVVEAVRTMRAAVQHKCSSVLDDFDEVAADIQRTHDDEAYNMQLEAGSKC